MAKTLKRFINVFFILALLACNMQAGKSQYILAERLFNDHRYDAAVNAFEKVIEQDPKGSLAQQAIFRIGIIQYLYLKNYPEAIKYFQKFVLLSTNTKLVFQAEKSIGEIYFSKLENYKLAIEQYKLLVDKYSHSEEKDFFLLRLSKSYYGMLDFENAKKVYEDILKGKPQRQYEAEALYQLGNTLFTESKCKEAIEYFQKVLDKFPVSRQAVFAQFGMGNCFEELEKPEEALAMYEKILDKHPSRNVVLSKINRLKKRMK